MKSFEDIPYIIYRDADVPHYCAYIRIPEDHPYMKIIKKKQREYIGGKWYYEFAKSAIPIEVHGGVTFVKHITQRQKWPQGFTPGYWVGWDYNHGGDAILGRELKYHGNHVWTKEEVENECKEVIEQLINAYKLPN